MKLRGWSEIGPDGGVLSMPYVPGGIIGIDDDDDELHRPKYQNVILYK